MSSRPAAPQVHAYAWHCDINTRWADNDCYGHVNNVVYYAFFDTAVNRYLIEYGGLEPSTSPAVGLVVESACQYFKSLAYPDLVRTAIRVGKLGNSSVRYEVGVFRGDDLEASAAGHFIHVYVDRETRRPVPVPEQTRNALLKLIRTPAPSQPAD